MSKKIFSVSMISTFIMCIIFSGCNNREENLYELGMDITETMCEMVESEDFASVVSSVDFSEIIAEIDTDNYDSPIEVYSVEMPKSEELVEFVNYSDEELWNKLSKELQDQIENRISFTTIITLINSQQGTEKLAFSSLYTAIKNDDKLKLDETVTYLYIFEKSVPIVVTFNENGHISGQFLFLDDLNSLSEVKNAFEEYECKVSKLDID